MNFEEFISEIKKRVNGYLGEEVKIEEKTVLKNNGVKLTGIVIFKEHQNCVPNIYLNGYYEQYMRGRNTEEIVSEILHYYEEHKIEQKINIDCFSDFNSIKNKLCYKVIHYEKNAELLKEIPYIIYLDLAIVFYCLIDDAHIGNGSILIRNEHLKRWQVTLKEVKENAFLNTPKLLQGKITSMEDVICDLLRKKMILEMENSIQGYTNSYIRVKEEMIEPIIQEMLEKIYADAKGPKMFVAGNESKNFGAAVILYDTFLKEFAESIHSDFYILPSSVHEVILIPAEKEQDEVCKLKEMVYEVNRTELAEEEVLSDAVYMYKREEECIIKL